MDSVFFEFKNKDDKPGEKKIASPWIVSYTEVCLDLPIKIKQKKNKG